MPNLIACPECGAQISASALTCPKCGTTKLTQREANTWRFLAIFGVGVVVLVLVWILLSI